jgi:molecular chaperone GrpE (heat shock protein)
MDHVFALQQAGAKSGQAALTAQLNGFQSACRDIVRRIGLVPTEARPGDPFDDKGHQCVEANGEPPADARVTEMVATGYTFQGQVLRLPVVRIGPLPTADAALGDPVDAQLELESESGS